MTVITIFLDAERFLREAVESVLSQTYDRWELLLVDDGSSDGSSRIARKYAEGHPDRIRYLEHPGHANLGMSASRNLGIQNAAGEFIAFVDADDVWLADKLDSQVKILRRHPEAAMVFNPTLAWYSWSTDGGEAARDYVTGLPFRGDRMVGGAPLLRKIVTDRAAPIYTCSMLARREAVLEVGGFEDQFRGLFEDQVFFSKLLLAYDVYAMSAHHDRYRQHADSHCVVASSGGGPGSKPMLEARRIFLAWLSEYSRSTGGVRLRWVLAYESWLNQYPFLVEARGRTRDAWRWISGRVTFAAFVVGRRVLPAALRERAWRAYTS